MEDNIARPAGASRLTPSGANPDVSMRDSVPSSARSHDDQHPPANPASFVRDAPHHDPSEVWRGAITRIQAQISLNTSLLESQRRQIGECEQSVGRLNHEFGAVIQAIEGLRAEIRSKPAPSGVARHDPGDLDVLVEQVSAITSKASEVDELKLQLRLMKNQVKRIEEQLVAAPRSEVNGPSAHTPSVDMPMHPAPASHRMLPHHQTASPHLHQHPHPHPQGFAQPPPPPPAASHHPQHQLPPMRTASLGSPMESRSTVYANPQPPPPAIGTLQSQVSAESGRGTPTDMSKQPAAPPNFRPADPLPPPSSLGNWRPAEPTTNHQTAALPHHSHHRTAEPDPHAGGWAAVNVAQPPKRPYEQPRPSPFGSPVSGSPKRPKLAPIMPRAAHPEDNPYAAPSHAGGSEMVFRTESIAPSDASITPSQSLSNVTGDGQAIRFITSAIANARDALGLGQEHVLHVHQHHPGRGGRGGRRAGLRGGRGRGRGRGGGGQHGGQHIGQHGRHHGGHHGGHHGEPRMIEMEQRLTPSEPRRIEWTGDQASPPPHANLPHHGRMLVPAGPEHDRDHEHVHAHAHERHDGAIPATPLGASAPLGSPDAITLAGATPQAPLSASKKTRTKPFRNADGVLIRKDGRPDMRSVSSAANLRKVHSKKDVDGPSGDGAAVDGAELDGYGSSRSPPGRDHDSVVIKTQHGEGASDLQRRSESEKEMHDTGGDLASPGHNSADAEMGDASAVAARASAPASEATPVPDYGEPRGGEVKVTTEALSPSARQLGQDDRAGKRTRRSTVVDERPS